MAIVQGLQQLVNVVANVIVAQGRIQDLEVDVVNVLEYQRWRLGMRIAHNVQELDDVGTTTEVLQDLDFTSNLLLLDRLQDLDDAAFVGNDIHALEHLTVFATAHLADDLIVVLVTTHTHTHTQRERERDHIISFNTRISDATITYIDVTCM
jgi:hypothetical protein